MNSEDLERIAQEADIIVSGYAFTRFGMDIRVLNLGSPDRAALLTGGGEMLETSMDDLELSIVSSLLKRNAKYLGLSHA